MEYFSITENTKGAMTTNIVSTMKQAANLPKEFKGLVKELDNII